MNLAQIKQDAREEWVVRLAQIAHTGKTCDDDFRSLDTLIDKVVDTYETALDKRMNETWDVESYAEIRDVMTKFRGL